MIAFIIEVRMPGKRRWHPISIARTNGSSNKLLQCVKERLPQLSNFEVRLRRFERIPCVHLEGEILEAIPVITDEGE